MSTSILKLCFGVLVIVVFPQEAHTNSYIRH